MTRYYVNDNAQRNGDHEVHALGFKWLPKKKTESTWVILISVF